MGMLLLLFFPFFVCAATCGYDNPVRLMRDNLLRELALPCDGSVPDDAVIVSNDVLEYLYDGALMPHNILQTSGFLPHMQKMLSCGVRRNYCWVLYAYALLNCDNRTPRVIEMVRSVMREMAKNVALTPKMQEVVNGFEPYLSDPKYMNVVVQKKSKLYRLIRELIEGGNDLFVYHVRPELLGRNEKNGIVIHFSEKVNLEKARQYVEVDGKQDFAIGDVYSPSWQVYEKKKEATSLTIRSLSGGAKYYHVRIRKGLPAINGRELQEDQTYSVYVTPEVKRYPCSMDRNLRKKYKDVRAGVPTFEAIDYARKAVMRPRCDEDFSLGEKYNSQAKGLLCTVYIPVAPDQSKEDVERLIQQRAGCMDVVSVSYSPSKSVLFLEPYTHWSVHELAQPGRIKEETHFNVMLHHWRHVIDRSVQKMEPSRIEFLIKNSQEISYDCWQTYQLLEGWGRPVGCWANPLVCEIRHALQKAWQGYLVGNDLFYARGHYALGVVGRGDDSQLRWFVESYRDNIYDPLSCAYIAAALRGKYDSWDALSDFWMKKSVTQLENIMQDPHGTFYHMMRAPHLRHFPRVFASSLLPMYETRTFIGDLADIAFLCDQKYLRRVLQMLVEKCQRAVRLTVWEEKALLVLQSWLARGEKLGNHPPKDLQAFEDIDRKKYPWVLVKVVGRWSEFDQVPIIRQFFDEKGAELSFSEIKKGQKVFVRVRVYPKDGMNYVLADCLPGLVHTLNTDTYRKARELGITRMYVRGDTSGRNSSSGFIDEVIYDTQGIAIMGQACNSGRYKPDIEELDLIYETQVDELVGDPVCYGYNAVLPDKVFKLDGLEGRRKRT